MAGQTVQDLVKANKPIYVYNRTGEFQGKQGIYVLEIKESGKRAAQIPIPATRYPFLLSGHVPPRLLAESTEFYQALSRGILVLVDPQEAQKILEDPIAQQSVQNAMRKLQPTKRKQRTPPELMTSHNRDDLVPPGADRGISGLPQASPTPLQHATAQTDAGVNPTIKQIVMDLETDPSLQKEKLLDLAGMEGLTEDDLGYLIGHCQDFSKILQWARTELASMIGEEEAADVEAEQQVERHTKPETSKKSKKPRQGRRKNRR